MEDQDIFLRNNTGSKSKSAIVDGFVVRINEFDNIKTSLVESKTISDIQNIIVIGQRGAGKTTLMHRLSYAILDDKHLSKRYIPILFSEEQYNLSDLTNLWEAVAIGIEDNFYKENLAAKLENIIESDDEYEKESLKLLQDFLISKDKTAILFIENINFFLKKLSEDEKKRFKKIFTSNSPLRVIGSSTSYNDGTIDFGDSFYKFFNIVQLDSLTQEECEKLLIKIGQQYGEEQQIKDVIANFPGRVEALRRLTGGVPRTISYLFQIFLDNENGKAIKDLYLLIDTLTLLYKSELDQLSTQQQKVVDAIARKWDAISVREIAKRTRLESKNISSILSYLEKNQLVEKVPTSTKNHLYRIKERFMNIWYLMRFGRAHDKENVKWLVRFFDAWCDESELAKRLRKHISNLKDGKYDAIAAIDMGNTFLSCENIPDTLKEELIKTTNSVLPNRL
ncbi:MarR family transcriptional regulator [Niabella defluvii]|nr:MarR family transcriptional regulator [Niabella sp. I65]